MNVKKILIILLLSIIYQLNTYSQVVNIEKKRKENQNGFTGVVNLGFDLVENAKHIIKFHNGFDIQYKKNAHALILLNELKIMKVDENDLINDGFQHLRYNYTFKDSSFLTYEAFVQHQYNTIKLIERRFLIGAGFRYRIINEKPASVYLGTLCMYEYEQRSNEERELLENARATSYISISWDILDNLYLRHISYYQPLLTYFKNYRIASETSLNIKVNDLIFFKMALKINLESHPSKGVKNTFYVWENALQFKF